MQQLALLFLLLLVWECSCSEVQIDERKNGETMYVDRDENVRLTCRPTDTETRVALFWFHPTDLITQVSNTDMTKHVYIRWDDSDTRLLYIYISGFKEDDQGKYYCKYINKYVNPPETVSEQFINIRVKQKLQVEKAPLEQWLPYNKTSIIYCSFRGSDITVRWFLNGNDIRTGDKYTINPKEGLKISQVRMSDAGTYVCQASGSGTEYLDVNIVVRVFERPVITYGPVVKFPVACINGQDCYLKCTATGVPNPQIIWYKSTDTNKPLDKDGTNKFFVDNRHNVGELRIRQAEFNKDDGKYICRAVVTSDAIADLTEDMYAEASVDIVVHYIPEFRNYEAMMNKRVDLGGKVELICEVYATEPLSMQFQKYGTYAPYTDGQQADDSRIRVWRKKNQADGRVHTLHLEINQVKYSDCWNYSCIAVNPAWNSTLNGTIQVQMRPNLTSNAISQQWGWLRNVTNITCVSYGMPHPTWRWHRNQGEIPQFTDNGTYRIFTWDYENYSQSWLQIYPDYAIRRWVFDFYVCSATNVKGNGSHKTHFREASAPNAPSVVDRSSSSSTVHLTLSPPDSDGGMSVWYYELKYRASVGQLKWYGPVQIPLDSDVSLHGLMPNTMYNIQLYARNAVGASHMPTSVSIVTKAVQNPSPVLIISSNHSLYPYSQTLRWRVPSTGGQPLTGYKIRVRPVKYDAVNGTVLYSLGNWQVYRPPFYNPYLSEYRLMYLDAGTFYQAEIRAITRKGMSEPQFTVFLTADADSLGRPDRVMGGAGRPACGAAVAGLCFMLLLLLLLLQ